MKYLSQTVLALSVGIAFYGMTGMTYASFQDEEDKENSQLTSVPPKIEKEEELKKTIYSEEDKIALIQEIAMDENNEFYTNIIATLQLVDLEKRQQIISPFLKVAFCFKELINLEDLLKKLLLTPLSKQAEVADLLICFGASKAKKGFLQEKGIEKILTTCEFLFERLNKEEKTKLLFLIKKHNIQNLEIVDQLISVESENWEAICEAFEGSHLVLIPLSKKDVVMLKHYRELRGFNRERAYKRLLDYCKNKLPDDIAKYHDHKLILEHFLYQKFKKVIGKEYEFYRHLADFKTIMDVQIKIYVEDSISK